MKVILLFHTLIYEFSIMKKSERHIEEIINLKGHWTSITSSSNFFGGKSWDFYIIRSVGMGNDCMPSFTFYGSRFTYF